jgi:hypothetical protein
MGVYPNYSICLFKFWSILCKYYMHYYIFLLLFLLVTELILAQVVPIRLTLKCVSYYSLPLKKSTHLSLLL